MKPTQDLFRHAWGQFPTGVTIITTGQPDGSPYCTTANAVMSVSLDPLLVLVSAFTGLEAVQQIYAHAIDNGYRFYSYGDAMCVQRADSGP